MKKKKPDPPKDFEVEDAEAAFGKLEDATRKLLSFPNKKFHAALALNKIKKRRRQR